MGQEFEAIKQTVTAEQAALFYGLLVNPRTHRAACPFHHGKNENLSFCKGGYYCFKCGASGSCIDFAMNFLELSSPLEAARRLDRDFGLKLFDRKPQIKRSWGEAERDRAERLERAFMRWCAVKVIGFRDEAYSIAFHLKEPGYYYKDRGRKAARHKQLSNGRNYALLSRFIVAETVGNNAEPRFKNFDCLHLDDTDFGGHGLLIWREPPGLSDSERRRVYQLFAANRKTMREDVTEWEASPSRANREYARHIREVFALD